MLVTIRAGLLSLLLVFTVDIVAAAPSRLPSASQHEARDVLTDLSDTVGAIAEAVGVASTPPAEDDVYYARQGGGMKRVAKRSLLDPVTGVLEAIGLYDAPAPPDDVTGTWGSPGRGGMKRSLLDPLNKSLVEVLEAVGVYDAPAPPDNVQGGWGRGNGGMVKKRSLAPYQPLVRPPLGQVGTGFKAKKDEVPADA